MLDLEIANKSCTSCSQVIKYIAAIFLFLFCSSANSLFAQVSANFTLDTTKGCVPLTVHCTSTENDGVVNWEWTTSDGQTSTDANPVFVFTKPGRFRIRLKTSDNSTADSLFKDVTANGISTRFTYRYDNICTTPVPVYFNAFDTANGNYHWDFGDSTVSIEQNPAHTYQSGGTYVVHLTTYSQEGCIDSAVTTIETGKVTVDFDAPVTSCSNSSVLFTSTSTSIPKSANWTVNGAVVSRAFSGFSYSFADPGTYIIRLTEDFGGCRFFKEKTITILRRPQAGFDQTGTLQSCLYPSAVQFSTASSNADTYLWNFGDGTTSTEANPIHTYILSGRFSPTLTVQNANGCSDSVTKPNLILLGPPIVTGLKGMPLSGCLPYTVRSSAIAISAEPIVSYDWDWGNGDHSADSAPAYTYTQKGYYNVTLTTKTASGCTDTFFVERAVSVGDSLSADFTVDKSIACGSEAFSFNATASGKPTNWSWRFGDGASSGGQSAKHQYLTTGSQAVTLVVNNNGCRTTVEKKDVVFVKPPIANINVVYDCTDQLRVNFTDASQGASSWQWNFGDGTTSSDKDPQLHVYASSGIYTVTLSTTNAECASTDTLIVPVLNTKPLFTFNPADGYLCRKASIIMGATNPDYIADYYWDFDNGKSAFSNTTISTFYDKAGVYYPSLVTKYKNGCYDTIYSPQAVHVTGPTASFNTGIIPNCLNKEVTFVDKSKTDGAHSIISWQWTSGDGFTSEALPTSQFAHSYEGYGNYKASLLIWDNNHCSDTAYYTVKINKLPLISAGNDTFVCDGKNKVLLTASGGVSYIWNTSSTLSCTDCPSPIASPSQQTDYFVTGTDVNGCSNTDTVQVKVIRPFNLVITNPSAEVCQNQKALLQASGADVYSWQPPEGLSSTTAASPYASPNATTTYVVTGSDRYHCFSQKGQVRVLVYANPQFDIQDSLIVAQKGDINLLQTAGSDDITSWQWLPSTGLSCTDCPQPYSTAVKSLTYTAVATTDHGCSDTDKVTIHVLCNQNKIYIPTAFTPNGDGRNDWFYVMSSIDNPIRSFAIFSRSGQRIFLSTNALTNNPSQGWDGKYNGQPMSNDTYIYRIEVLCNETIVPFTGTVTVVR